MKEQFFLQKLCQALIFCLKIRKKNGVGNFPSCMDEERNAMFHIQLLIAIQESTAFLLKSLNGN